MFTKLKIENFRSIESAEIDLGRINVLTGSNNSGKSSFIYALLALRNIFQNSNRSYDSLFNFDNIINLGGFREVVYLKDEKKSIKFAFEIDGNEQNFELKINPAESHIKLEVNEPFKVLLEKNISFPFSSEADIRQINYNNESYQYIWRGFNGITERLMYSNGTDNDIFIFSTLNNIVKNMNSLDVISIQRTFTKLTYNAVPLQSQITTEDELATFIALDRDLVSAISHYTEKILDRVFTVHNIIGAGFFYLQTRNRETGFTSDLVNEGTGTSQIIMILAKALQKNKSFICIDEPEIHLHPSIITKLVDALVEIAYEENKQFLISTHNEHLMSCLLASVSDKKLKPDDLKVYYLTKDGKKTTVEHQVVNEHGQISGGLKNFYEAELENLAKLFNIIEP